MKKWVRKLLISLGILLIIILLANFGLNIWLKTQLPKYIKNNTDYKISYKNMDVDLLSGNIFSTGITVNSKNLQNINVIGIQGTIDTLKVSRFGIYNAVFNKQITSSDLLLSKPNLNVILAKPVDAKTGKKRSPFLFENIRINEGNIRMFRYTKQKFFSVKDLNLYVEDLQMNEESVEDKLPVVFDQYSIKGKDFFFRPDDIYALQISNVETKNGQMSIDDFRLTPLVTFEQFRKYYPKKTQLFQFNVEKMQFKNAILKKNKVSLAGADLFNPDLFIYTTDAVPVKAKKPFNFELSLDDVKLNNATVQVMKPDGNKLLYAKRVNLNINQLKLDKETREELIPVGYKDFRFSAQDILYSNHQDFNVKSLTLTPKKGEIKSIAIVPNGYGHGKTSMNLTVRSVGFTINKWEFANKKLNLDVQGVLADHVQGTIKAGEIKSNKKANFSAIQSPVIIRKVVLRNSDITYEKDNQPLLFKNLNATVNDIQLNSRSDGSGLAVDVKSYKVTSDNFAYKTRFYTMTSASLNLDQNNVRISQFAVKPLVSRAQFIKMIPVERDLYDIKAGQITANGTWNLFSDNKSINASNVMIQSADANIFRSKIPNDDPKEKPLYSRMLRSVKIPMIIDNLNLKNSVLVYEEDTPESAGPGKLIFSNFNMNVKNLNSAKMKGKPTRVDIKINCSFMNLAPLSVNWNFDVADQRDIFAISGRTTGLPAAGINPFIRPYLHVTATGTIQEMLFNFKGNPKGLNGSFNLRHKDLKVAVLDKKNREKKGFLTAIANLLVKSDSGKLPEDVEIEDVERDPTKSFFNMFWKGIEQGLKKTLIGINIDTSKKNNDDNKADGVTKQTGKEAVKNQDQKNEKKGFLKGIFKKKEKSGTD